MQSQFYKRYSKIEIWHELQCLFNIPNMQISKKLENFKNLLFETFKTWQNKETILLHTKS